jgi:hypothetical protein
MDSFYQLIKTIYNQTCLFACRQIQLCFPVGYQTKFHGRMIRHKLDKLVNRFACYVAIPPKFLLC